MRTLRLSILLAALAAGVPSAQAKLKVHEWGTFTVLQAPDGSTVTWYLGQNEGTPLPEFVTGSPDGNNIQAFSKFSTAFQPHYPVRMETPVLYFYPDGPMEVKVEVDYKGGVVTESYPHAFREKTGVSWKGSLLPVDAAGLKLVPDASGPAGRHYATARAVPDAWLFRRAVPPPAVASGFPGLVKGVSVVDYDLPESGLLPPPVLIPGMGPVTKETDHFIFYRGAGNDVSRTIQVTTTDDHAFTLTNHTAETVPVLFLLRVADGKSVWRRVDKLTTYKIRQGKKPELPFTMEGVQQVPLPDASEPLATSTARLKAEMLTALEKEGLTKAEAAAMVATWDNLWFEETGTRVLAVLPQPWVDAVLPLQITPKPEEIERVFVTRQELISLAQQNTLVNLLSKAEGDPAAARAELKRLALGRFAMGMMERAVAVKTREVSGQMRSRFAELSAPPAPPAATTPPVPVPVIGRVK